ALAASVCGAAIASNQEPSVRLGSLRVLILLLLLVPPAASAPAAFDFYDRGPYRSAVPRPAEVLGYAPGTFHTSYGNMERYVEALVHAAPDRVVREAYGRSYEFRE